jgi:hypothetical protein
MAQMRARLGSPNGRHDEDEGGAIVHLQTRVGLVRFDESISDDLQGCSNIAERTPSKPHQVCGAYRSRIQRLRKPSISCTGCLELKLLAESISRFDSKGFTCEVGSGRPCFCMIVPESRQRYALIRTDALPYDRRPAS